MVWSRESALPFLLPLGFLLLRLLLVLSLLSLRLYQFIVRRRHRLLLRVFGPIAVNDALDGPQSLVWDIVLGLAALEQLPDRVEILSDTGEVSRGSFQRLNALGLFRLRVRLATYHEQILLPFDVRLLRGRIDHS